MINTAPVFEAEIAAAIQWIATCLRLIYAHDTLLRRTPPPILLPDEPQVQRFEELLADKIQVWLQEHPDASYSMNSSDRLLRQAAQEAGVPIVDYLPLSFQLHIATGQVEVWSAWRWTTLYRSDESCVLDDLPDVTPARVRSEYEALLAEIRVAVEQAAGYVRQHGLRDATIVDALRARFPHVPPAEMSMVQWNALRYWGLLLANERVLVDLEANGLQQPLIRARVRSIRQFLELIKAIGVFWEVVPHEQRVHNG